MFNFYSQVFILLAVVAVASANPLLGYGAAPIAVGHAGIVNTGVSSVARSDDGYGNYHFNYNIKSATGGNAQAESGDGYGNKKGSYSLGVIDGRERVVDYVADGLGFRAAIRTNEPGTAPLQPAAVSLSAPDHSGIALGKLIT